MSGPPHVAEPSGPDAETLLPEGSTSAGASSKGIARGTTLGRYVVIDLVGRGGMGVVVSAYDPELDRRVAIKLLRWAETEAPTASRGGARLLREAQALAKLAHPNVVAVHDVGTIDGVDGTPSVFVAMELLDGEPVSQWLERERPPWREVLAVFVAAARGLEAAHAAGVIHRDFKPENVRRTASGRVVVLDFGLARAQRERDTDSSDGARVDTGRSSSGRLAIVDPRLTLSGAVMGTPAFMSPEQAAGRELDAATDQFSFCASLYLGLYGELPFGQKSNVLARATWDGELRPAPARTRVPTWLRAVLARGLAREPGARHADMTALLTALQRDPSRRWRALLGVAALATALGVGWWSASRLGAPADACAHVGDAIADEWTQPRRDALVASLTGDADVEYAERVASAVDLYSVELGEQRVAACRSDDTREPAARADASVRIACLERAHGHLAALLAVLEQPGRAASALPAVHALPAPSQCADAAALRRSVPMPDDATLAALVAQLRMEMAAARSMFQAGDAQAAYVAIEPVLVHARTLGFEPLLAEALVEGSWSALNVASFDLALARAEEGYLLAEAHGVDPVASSALAVMTVVHTRIPANHQLAAWYSREQEALVRRLGNPPDRHARVFADRARLVKAQGDIEGAIELLERADSILAEAGHEDSDRVATLDNLGSAYAAAGRDGEAMQRFEQALATAELALGPGHNLRVNVMVHLAQEHWARGERARALPLLHDALARARRAYTPMHPNLVAVVNSVALAYRDIDAPRSVALFEEGMAIAARQGHVSSTLKNNLAHALLAAGRPSDAMVLHRELLAEYGEDAAERALWHDELGDDLLVAGEWVRAREEFRAALAALGDATNQSSRLARAHVGIARAELALGEHHSARQDAQRGLELSELVTDDPDGLALARYTLARALRAERVEPGRQMELVVAAHRTWAIDPIARRREVVAVLAFVLGEALPL